MPSGASRVKNGVTGYRTTPVGRLAGPRVLGTVRATRVVPRGRRRVGVAASQHGAHLRLAHDPAARAVAHLALGVRRGPLLPLEEDLALVDAAKVVVHLVVGVVLEQLERRRTAVGLDRPAQQRVRHLCPLWQAVLGKINLDNEKIKSINKHIHKSKVRTMRKRYPPITILRQCP